MAENKFKAYVLERRWNDAVRDFVHDAQQDPDLPDPARWEELEAYIQHRNPAAPAKTLDAAKHVWQLYMEERLGNA